MWSGGVVVYSCELFAELPTAKLVRVADGKV